MLVTDAMFQAGGHIVGLANFDSRCLARMAEAGDKRRTVVGIDGMKYGDMILIHLQKAFIRGNGYCSRNSLSCRSRRVAHSSLVLA